jgi:hypothetical protein
MAPRCDRKVALGVDVSTTKEKPMHAVKISSRRHSNLTCSDHQTRIKPGENIIDSVTFERVKVDIDDWEKLGWVSVTHVAPQPKPASEAPAAAKPEGGAEGAKDEPTAPKASKAKKPKPASEAPAAAKPEGE